MDNLEQRAKELAELEDAINEANLIDEEIKENESFEHQKNELTQTSSSGFEVQVKSNEFVNAMTNNEVAVQMAREEYNGIKNQKSIAKGIKKVAIDNTKADIDSANIQVEEKQKNNKVKRQEIKNELYRLKKEREYLEREQQHKLEMQRAQHLKDKYEDLLLRTCRKKQKDENGKWMFVNDKNGEPIINIPSKFKFFWIRLLDGIVSTLNLSADIFGALNKNVIKGAGIILILLLLLVPPFRIWLLGLIGISF